MYRLLYRKAQTFTLHVSATSVKVKMPPKTTCYSLNCNACCHHVPKGQHNALATNFSATIIAISSDLPLL